MVCCRESETTIGIIIGSCFTLAGVIVNGVVTSFQNRSAHDREIEERKRCEQKKEDDDVKKKREQVYLKFINHYSFLISLGSFRVASGLDVVQWNNILENVYKDDIKAAFRSVSMIMTDVSLYGTNEMSAKCTKFLDKALSVLLGEMKQELGMK